ncbi:hypothetical protein ACFA67_004553 [Salmonella enterica]
MTTSSEKRQRIEQRRIERGEQRITVPVPAMLWARVGDYAALRGIDKRAVVTAALLQLIEQESQHHDHV